MTSLEVPGNSAGLAARKTALSIVTQVLRKHRPLDSQLESLKHLPSRDAGFARALASQTLRHFGELDALIRHFVPKPLAPHKAGPAMEILLLGACELLILKVPPHAAVDAANNLAAADGKAVHFKSLINAVLRRIAREGEAVHAGLDAVRLNTPDWLWTRWSAQYGEDVARTIAAAHGQEAPLDIRLKQDGVVHPESETLFGLSCRVTDQGRVEELPGFTEGGWWVQDVAATLPVMLLGDVAGKRVIDLCAAPGGKTLQLAAMGAQVTSVEIEPARATRLRENLARIGLSAEITERDVRDFAGTAPLVLLDAPCTATGTIRRHPDLPWIKSAADVMAQTASSYDLLESAAHMVEQEGLLVFAVCSLEREEGEEQIAAFLSGHREFRHVPVEPREIFGHGEWISPQGDLRTLPCHLPSRGGMDGFYAAKLRRL
ncbi:MAG TPA: transcription antitermination factor NusB [Rhizomicrobium sp.]|jgi:16S rRNA (cytosine967-C5)-methyltransferase|nr:transcription antitermination factor NusB [Rhizomicrobium sp.]